MAPGRLIAGLGTGDSKSAAGEPRLRDPLRLRRRAPAGAARVRGAACSAPVCRCGWEVVLGSTTELAVDLGAAVNLWEGQPAALAGLRSRCEVTWAGPVAGGVAQIAQWLAGAGRCRRHVGGVRVARVDRGRGRGGRAGARRLSPSGVERRCASRGRVQGGTNLARDGVPTDQRSAPLRLRAHRGAEAGGPPSRSRRHRSRVREPRPAVARRCGGEARRSRPQSQEPPVLGEQGHPQAPPGDLLALPPPASASSSTPRPRWSRPSGPRRACRT